MDTIRIKDGKMVSDMVHNHFLTTPLKNMDGIILNMLFGLMDYLKMMQRKLRFCLLLCLIQQIRNMGTIFLLAVSLFL